MIQLINKLKKNQKGFTLVELIVVLVILAILAAFTIPAMLGFVQDARDKASLAQGREVYVTAQGASSDVAATSTAGKIADTNDDKDKIKNKMDSLISSDIAIAPDDIDVVVAAETATTPTELTAKLDSNHAAVWVTPDGKVMQSNFADAAAKKRVEIKWTASGNSAEIVDNVTAPVTP